MDKFIKIVGQILQGIFTLIGALLKGILDIASSNPKAFAVVVGVISFMLALRYVRGFGEMAAQIIALLLIIWVLKAALLPKGKKK